MLHSIWWAWVAARWVWLKIFYVLLEYNADILQVRQGEVAVSARAIDEATIKLLWNYLLEFPKSSSPIETTSRKRKAEQPELWAGYWIRIMLHLIYIIATLCLLRHDEGLRIMWTDITLDASSTGRKRITIRLPFRKTSQYGGKQVSNWLLNLLIYIIRYTSICSLCTAGPALALSCLSICQFYQDLPGAWNATVWIYLSKESKLRWTKSQSKWLYG